MSDTPDSKKNTTKKDVNSDTAASSVDESVNTDKAAPIDTDFEDIDLKDDTTPYEPRPSAEKSGPGWGALLTTGAFSSIIGAAIAMVATGSSGVDTAKFAPAEVKNQIVAVEKVQTELNERVQKVWGIVSELDARQTSSVEELNLILEERIEGELSIREELELLTAHLELLVDNPTANASLSLDSETPENSGDGPDAVSNSGEAIAYGSSYANFKKLIARIETLEIQLNETTEAQTDASPSVETNASSQELAGLLQRLSKVEQTDANLKKAMQARSDAIRALNVGLSQTRKAVKSVEADIVDLRKAKITSGAEAEIERAKARTQKEAIVDASLALAQVEASSARGKPFYEAWKKLSEALPENKNVDQLEDIARRGAPPLEELSTRFSEMEKSLAKKATLSNKNDGWDWARNALGGVVSVKRTEGENIDNAGRIENIIKALQANKLEDVVANAESIDGPLAQDIQEWLEEARRSAALKENMTAVKQEVLKQNGVITPPSNENPPKTSPQPQSQESQ